MPKISQHESKSVFSLSRSHVGQDSGFSRKIAIISTKSGWLDSLSSEGCQLLEEQEQIQGR